MKKLDEHKKIVKVEFFYDPGELIGGLLKGAKLDTSAEGELPNFEKQKIGVLKLGINNLSL